MLKAKYYKNSEFVDARRGHDPSYTWMSIWGAKSLLLEGLKWRVGNGTSIRVWDDAWLPGNGSHFVPTPRSTSDPELRVSDLIDFEGQRWNEEVLREVFVEDEQQLVLDLPLSPSWPRDLLYWWPTSNGIYSVRSAYWLGMLGRTRTYELYYGTRDKELWSYVWRLNGPPKLSHFLWRARRGSLATMGVLFGRHIRQEKACPICAADEASIIHSLFDCKHASTIWGCSEFGDVLVDAPRSSFADRFVWIAGKIDKEKHRNFSSLVWAAWCCRNRAIFEDANVDVVCLATGFVQLVDDYHAYKGKVSVVSSSARVLSARYWTPPLRVP